MADLPPMPGGYERERLRKEGERKRRKREQERREREREFPGPFFHKHFFFNKRWATSCFCKKNMRWATF